MQPNDRARLAEIFKQDPINPNVRVQKCIDAFQNALEQFDCEAQVSIHLANGLVTPEIRIVPIQRQAMPVIHRPQA
jgi:hypothetical protein